MITNYGNLSPFKNRRPAYLYLRNIAQAFTRIENVLLKTSIPFYEARLQDFLLFLGTCLCCSDARLKFEVQEGASGDKENHQNRETNQYLSQHMNSILRA